MMAFQVVPALAVAGQQQTVCRIPLEHDIPLEFFLKEVGIYVQIERRSEVLSTIFPSAETSLKDLVA